MQLHRLMVLTADDRRTGVDSGGQLDPLLGPRADEVLLVMVPPGRRQFLFEQPRQDQQWKRLKPSEGGGFESCASDPRDQARSAVLL